MTQMLIMATVFIWLKVYSVCILQSERGAYTRDKTTYAGTGAKNAGGLMHKGGRNCGILRYISVQFSLITQHACARGNLKAIGLPVCHCHCHRRHENCHISPSSHLYML